MCGAAVRVLGFVKGFLFGLFSFFYEAVRDVHINSFFKSVNPGCLTLLHKRDYWCGLTHINVLKNGFEVQRLFESTFIVEGYYCFLTSLCNMIFILILRKLFKFFLYCVCISNFYYWAESS